MWQTNKNWQITDRPSLIYVSAWFIFQILDPWSAGGISPRNHCESLSNPCDRWVMTMRNVAHALNCGVMPHYHRIANKDALLAAMLECEVGRIDLPA